MYKIFETKEAKRDKKIILKSYPKVTQKKLEYFVADILSAPRNKNTVGCPEELKHGRVELWSSELTPKDRIVYGIEPGMNYDMPEEKEIIVFYQYSGHYQDK
ncbi:MAG: type II toxin-antitoxin system YoeB family toxin [Candidatus Symbiothrix sp.]|jgi:Txe/YoeB family toxin of Txe-Axe toxin-antitoxin module|nr:type II toxin-antitoxin system YoeB family toxin [Candidatus Symbiothrix sp.]